MWPQWTWQFHRSWSRIAPCKCCIFQSHDIAQLYFGWLSALCSSNDLRDGNFWGQPEQGYWEGHLTDVTQADEGTNSILTDNANRAIQGNVANNWLYLVDKLYKFNIQVIDSLQIRFLHWKIQVGGANYCKWRHLVAKFATNASGAIWGPNLQLMQVTPSGGQIVN